MDGFSRCLSHITGPAVSGRNATDRTRSRVLFGLTFHAGLCTRQCSLCVVRTTCVGLSSISMEKRLVKLSKFLSLVLRHKPEEIGIRLNDGGWVEISDLLAACGRHGIKLSGADLDEVVVSNDKKRFAISEDRLSIRASQGHSLEVALGYEPAAPPDLLYHGTAERFLTSIHQRGLVKGRRQHVHLSTTVETALNVGGRHGKPVALTVNAARMHEDSMAFYLSANGVWLTEVVPPSYLIFP